MPTIFDQLQNNRGIRVFDTQLNDFNVLPGKIDTFLHTNGNLYAVFARRYDVSVSESRLYFSSSSDEGNTWTTPVQLTTGAWDDEPAIFQIKPSDTASDIGLVFTRATNYSSTGILHRVDIDINGTVLDALAVVTGAGTDTELRFITVFRTNSKFTICTLDRDSTGTFLIRVYENTINLINPQDGFLQNSWTARTATNPFSSTEGPHTLRIRQLSNNDWMAISSIRTAYDGSTTLNKGILRGNIRLDLCVSFSNDAGVTWSTKQQLTSYASTPATTLVGGKSCLDADVVQLTDDSLSIIFQEGYPAQHIRTDTTPGLGSLATNGTKQALYHATKNLLIIAADDVTTGGLYIVDLTAGTTTRLHIASTPALWNNKAARIALSSDDKYLAVAYNIGSSTGALDIIDTTDSSIASWTVKTLRNLSNSGIRNDDIEWCEFATTTKLFFAYGSNSGSAGIWGGIVDDVSLAVGSMTIIDLNGSSNQVISSRGNVYYDTAHNALLVGSAGRLWATNATTGASITGFAVTGLRQFGTYDNINTEVVWSFGTGGVEGIKRYSWDGVTLSLLETQSTTTDPSFPGQANLCLTLPNYGAIFWAVSGSSNIATFYNFNKKRTLGPFQTTEEQYLNFAFGGTNQIDFASFIKSGQWIAMPLEQEVQFISTNNVGRLRGGNFTYNSGTLQLDTGSGDFYDLVNSLTVGLDDFDQVQFPRITRRTDNSLVITGMFCTFNRLTYQFATILGIIEPNAQKIQIRANILNTTTQNLQMRGRLLQLVTTSISMQASLRAAQCIKMQAKIAPRNTQQLSMLSAIKNRKTTTLLNSFTINSPNIRKYKMSLLASGANPTRTFTMGAKISRPSYTKITVNFIVPIDFTDGIITYIFDQNIRTENVLFVRARIAKSL